MEPPDPKFRHGEPEAIDYDVRPGDIGGRSATRSFTVGGGAPEGESAFLGGGVPGARWPETPGAPAPRPNTNPRMAAAGAAAEAILRSNRHWRDSAELIRWLAGRPDWTATLDEIAVGMDGSPAGKSSRRRKAIRRRFERARERLLELGPEALVRLTIDLGSVRMVPMQQPVA